jgi:hypothetical protein
MLLKKSAVDSTTHYWRAHAEMMTLNRCSKMGQQAHDSLSEAKHRQ